MEIHHTHVHAHAHTHTPSFCADCDGRLLHLLESNLTPKGIFKNLSLGNFKRDFATGKCCVDVRQTPPSLLSLAHTHRPRCGCACAPVTSSGKGNHCKSHSVPCASFGQNVGGKKTPLPPFPIHFLSGSLLSFLPVLNSEQPSMSKRFT